MKWKLLVMAGGGIRGRLSARLLTRLPGLVEDADVYAGASVGGILAGFFACGGTAPSAHALLKTRGGDIFGPSNKRGWYSGGGWLRASYGAAGVDRLLADVFQDKTLADGMPCVIPAVAIKRPDSREAGTLKAWSSIDPEREDQPFRFRDVCRATSAAPSYFPSHTFGDPLGRGPWECWDAGLISNLPIGPAIAEVRELDPAAECTVFSIGTGLSEPDIGGGDRGGLRVLSGVLGVAVSGAVESTAYLARDALGARHFHLNPSVPDWAMDDLSAGDDMDAAADAFDLGPAKEWLGNHW